MPVAFYDKFIQPIFALGTATVWVLPDIKPMGEFFGVAPASSPGFDALGSVGAPVQGDDQMFGACSARRNR